jgi:predicted AAA+ superfamily ATPase
MWYDRTISDHFASKSRGLDLFPAWLLLGPRQVGKSSLFGHHSTTSRMMINLDDLETRQRANEDPFLFSKTFKLPLSIDEIQYAPELLSPIKQLIDSGNCKAGDIWLTGSQNFSVMSGVRESLAGRIAVLNLFGLTDSEKDFSTSDPIAFFSNILETGFPKLRGVTDTHARSLYLSSYIATYLERDVRELLAIEKRREFEIFVKLCAHRSAQLANFDALASDAGISAATAKQWLSLLADSFLIRILQPWHSNLNKRILKTPKIVFSDAGICAHLCGWKSPEQAAFGPSAGALFETHVIANIQNHLKHSLSSASCYFWRTKDGEEIDCLIDLGDEVIAVEVKMGTVDRRDLVSIKKARIERLSKAYVVSLTAHDEPSNITDEWSLISLKGLLKRLG